MLSSGDKLLDTFVCDILICSTISLSSFGGIPSTTCDLLSMPFETCLKLCFHCCFPVIRHFIELSVYFLPKQRNTCCYFLYYLPIFFKGSLRFVARLSTSL